MELGDEMNLVWLFYIIEILVWSVSIFTGLSFGLTMVGIKVQDLLKKTIFLSFGFGLIGSVAHIFYPSDIITFLLVIILFSILVWLLKMPVAQLITAGLLALVFNILVISLLEYNVFYSLLEMSGVSIDTGTKLSIDAFAMLTNLFVSILIITKAPILFPINLFEKTIHPDDQEISFGTQVYTIILILFLLIIGLYYTSIELSHLRISYRWFLTLWSLAVTVAIIVFQHKIILFKNEKVQILLDQQYQRELLSFFGIIQSQRHDFNIHLTAINGMIQQKKYEDCRIYIEEIVKSATSINDLLPLHHPATAAMLSTFRERAAAKGIKISFLIMNDLRNCPCSVYEINKVIGNLIQNALDEIEQHPKRGQEIVVEMTTERHQLAIKVTNEYDETGGMLPDLFQVGFSTKHQHEGLGLPVVKRIVEKYHGIVYPELDGPLIRICVLIPEKTTAWG